MGAELDLDALGAARSDLLAELLRARLGKTIPVANPAAGADWAVAVPSGVFWIPLAIQGLFTTSAAAVTRWVALQANGDGRLIWQMPPNVSAQASIAFPQNWSNGIAPINTGNRASGEAKSLPPIPLLPGWTIGTQTLSIDVADTWTAISVYVRELSLAQIEQAAEWMAKRGLRDAIPR